MTRIDAKTHGKVMRWWTKNSDKGVYFYNVGLKIWSITHTPNFITSIKYVENDKFALLRIAKEDGKTIQIKSHQGGEWKACPPSFLWNPLFKYRIESSFPVGSWVTFTKDNLVYLTQVVDSNIFNNYEGFKLWEPKVGELICYPLLVDKVKSYIVTKYTNNMKDYKNIAPMQFMTDLVINFK